MNTKPHYQFSAARVLLTVLVMNTAMIAHADEERPIVPEEIKLDRPVDFAMDIAPIFQANCVACHNKAKSEGQLILEDVASIMKGGSSGHVVVPGKPDESYLYGVAARVEESFMPPIPNAVQAKKLTSREVGLLRQWIIEGAKTSDTATASNMNWQAINPALNAIYAVDADPFGRFIAAGRAGNVSVYDLTFSNNVAVLSDPELSDRASPQQQSHLDYVHAVAFHPNGNLLATSGFQVVKLWERKAQQPHQPFKLPSGTPIHIVDSPDRKRTAIQNDAGVIFTTDDAKTSTERRLDGFPPSDFALLAVGGLKNESLIFSKPDGIILIVNLADGKTLATSTPLMSQPVSATWADASSSIVILNTDGSLQPLTLNAEKYELNTGETTKSDRGPIRQIEAAGQMLMCRIEGNTVEIRDTLTLKPGVAIQSGTPNITAALSPDGQRLLTVSPEGLAELWSSADGKLVAALTADLLKSQALQQRIAQQSALTARITVVKKQITDDEKRVTEQKDSLKKSEEDAKKATEAATAAQTKADTEASQVAAAKKASEEKPDDAGLKKKLGDAQTAEQKARETLVAAQETLKSAQKGVQLSLQAIARAESRVAERKQLLTVVETEGKSSADARAAAEETAKVSVVTSHAIFAHNNIVATIDSDGTTRLWNAADGAAVDVFSNTLQASNRPERLHAIADALLIKYADGTISTVDLFPSWKLVQTMGPQPDGKPSLFVDRVLALAFSPDGSMLAAGGGEASRSGELTLWDVATGSLIRTIAEAHSDTVYGLEFSRDGKLLASAAADKFVKVFDVASGQHVRSYEGHTHHVMDVSWKGDGTQLASAGADNAIKVWDVESGEQTRTINTYSKQVTALQFIGMEDEFISCSGDKRVFRHRAANGGTVREFKGCPDYVYCSTTTQSGDIVVAGCEDGILRVWNGKDGKEIAAFTP